MQITRNMRARTTRIPIETGSTNKESLFLTVGSSVRCKILIMLVVIDITISEPSQDTGFLLTSSTMRNPFLHWQMLRSLLHWLFS